MLLTVDAPPNGLNMTSETYLKIDQMCTRVHIWV